VSVVVVNYNCGDVVGRTLGSLRSQTWPDVEVVVVDNASTDGSMDMVAERFPEARRIALGRNVGFAEANNVGVQATTGELVMLLNPDAWLEPGGLARLAEVLETNPTVGVVGGTVRHEDGTVQEIGNRIDRTGFPIPLRTIPVEPAAPRVFFVGGCAMMMRRAQWDRLGGFDGRFFMFFEEVDLQWRAQREGLDVAVAPDVTVWHLGGVTLSGGYAVDGRHRTNPQRIYLRERNTLASVIRNGDGSTIAWAALGWAVNVLEALAFLALGQREVARQYPRALWWNVRRMPEHLRLRRTTRPRFTRRDRDLPGWARGSGKLRVLRAGIPTVEGR
jgi:N-acetylglucosaminyl-diphospho-decaprenol L-rhamnosyltransferase